MNFSGSIVRQLRWLGVAPALLMLGLLLLALTWQRFGDAEEELKGRGVFMSRYLAAASEYGVISGSEDELLHQARLALQHSDVRVVIFRDEDGEVLLRRDTPGPRVAARCRRKCTRSTRTSLPSSDICANCSAPPRPLITFVRWTATN